MSSKHSQRRVSLRAEDVGLTWVPSTGSDGESAETVRERALSVRFAERYDREGLLRRYGRFAAGLSDIDGRMRRVILRSLVRRLGSDVLIGPGVMFTGESTIDIGDRVRIGAHAHLLGEPAGEMVLGNDVQIGPQCLLDGRSLTIGPRARLWPGVRVLTSMDAMVTADASPAVAGEVRIGPDARIGANAVILPGVTIGDGAVVGAGVVVSDDVPAGAVLTAPAGQLSHHDEVVLRK